MLFGGASADRISGGSGNDVLHGGDGHDGAGEPGVPVRRPLLSQQLPPSEPGMLRPRPVDAFTLPVQRPAFDVGDVAPAEHP